MKKGFTIAEVALVIAIGGLIFLMAMLALPGLRASQRDAERREDVMFLVGKIKDYQSNNRGALPSTNLEDGGELIEFGGGNSGWSDFYNSYLGENFTDPNGENYKLRVVTCNVGGTRVPDVECSTTKTGEVANVADKNFPNNYTITVVIGATCKNEQAVASANSRKVAVMYRLEGSGSYCEND